jgi:mRNA interferase MazF
MPRQPRPRRGEVWLVSLDPSVGHEIQKTRPAVIVTNDDYIRYNWVVLVVPLTSHTSAEYD